METRNTSRKKYTTKNHFAHYIQPKLNATKKIIIPYFPLGLKYATPAIFLLGAYFILNRYYVLGGVCVLFAFLVLTTNYVTEISLEQKKYYDYISIAGLKMGMESTSFIRLEKIVITKGNNAQRVNSRLQSRTLQWADYTGTLHFDHNKTLDLVTHIDKAKLVAGLKEFAIFLEVPIEDRSR